MVESAHCPYQYYGENGEIPVVDDFYAEDSAEVVLVAKLIESAGCDPVVSEWVVHAVAEVQQYAYGIRDYVRHPCQVSVPFPLCGRERKHGKDYVQDIGVAYR